MASDLYWGNVVFAAHYDTDYSDLKGHTPTASGAITISSGDSGSFGGGALYAANQDLNSGVTYTGSDLSLGTGDFTIETFINQPYAFGSSIYFFELGSVSENLMQLYLPGGHSNNWLSLFDGVGGEVIVTTAFPLGVRTHFEYGRKGDANYFFIGGQLAAFWKRQTDFNGTTLKVSGRAAGYGLYDGYIDDFLITKGVCRHTDSFTPPSAAFASSTKTISGAVQDVLGNPAARTVRAYRRSDGVLIGSATSNGTTGAYSMDCADDTEVSLIMLDDAGGTLENDQILRTTPV